MRIEPNSMNEPRPDTRVARHSAPASRDHVSHGKPIQLWLLAVLCVLLMAAPRSRVVFIAPIYFIDILALLLLLLPLHTRLHRWVPRIPMTSVVVVFFLMIIVSETRGMLEYGAVMEPVYMMARYTLALSLFYTIPRVVSRPDHIDLLLKGVMLGTLISSVVVILYSLGPTRSLVIDYLFSNSVLNPSWKRMLEAVAIFGAGEVAMRGRSLVGAATMTAGFLGATWPIAFIAYHKFKKSMLWRRLALATIILAPVAILMTYGRGAWIMVGAVILLIALFGFAHGRRILLAALAVGAIAYSQVNISPDLFFFDRVIGETQETLENPLLDASTKERIYSFVEPFDHLMSNPEWLVAGAGQSGNKMRNRGNIREQIYDEIGLATHSGFAKSYYNFGVVAALCQVLFIVLGFHLIITRILHIPKTATEQKFIWQSLLMSWVTYSLWWASGHGMVGEPRGVMLSFLLMGLLLTFEKIRVIENFAMNSRRTERAD